MSFVLYTYTESDEPECRAYGPGTQEEAEAAAGKLPEGTKSEVLEVGSLSERYQTPADATHAIYRSRMVYSGPSVDSIYLTSDAAVADALCSTWPSADEAFTAMVLPLEAMPV